jgi:hypothetical protein
LLRQWVGAGENEASSLPRQVPTDPAADYDWFLSRQDARERFAGQVVILHQRRIVGSGGDYWEALEDFRRGFQGQPGNLPDRDLLFIAVPAALADTELPVDSIE